MLLKKLLALFEEHQIDFFEVKVRCDHAGSVVARVSVFGERAPIDNSGCYWKTFDDADSTTKC